MKSNYDALGNYIRLVDTRNTDLVTEQVLGINIDKYFMPSVANVIGTDLSKYKLITKGKFACNPMHVGRDERLPVALYTEDEPAIVSPAYFMFEIIDSSILNEDYLMMWFRRPEFDRLCWLRTDGSVRGGITWDDICRMKVPVPPLNEQIEIVQSYQAITDRIALKKQINDNLEATLTAVFTEIFSAAEATEQTKLSELMTFGNGKSRPKTDGTIPVYGGNGILSYTDQYNIENAILIGRVGAYCGSVYLEQGICWVSDNAIFAKSKVSIDEFFDYFLLKKLNLFNHHVGTGQQLLTQEILNNIEVAKPNIEQIEIFNAKAKAVFQSISANRDEIIRLQELSDLLLSRLAG
ncbi:hypothetical protein B5F08_08530 [Anaeromassilibacillus sp. An172]|uniref:restriction endonuclease subunit S n=1 Tax=Anaeromassilibacillus sp. An172 TaxID=1965570 RepID=UPI000B39BA84|nr:restriction endonuclease subunit S [Anaeromassilibacillus sp. An172]OUP77593.1 hypothetical protein B5F08_08530 [Anaeromassilibacillus sp. An172]